MKRPVILSVLTLALLAVTALASPPAPTINADQALERLARGNERFVSSKPIHPNQDALRRSLTAKEGQKPFASILACADSRVPPEVLFDTGLGDLFVIRVAGNTTYFDQAGSIEYGSEHLGVPLVVVLGHTKCGAVSAVVNEDHVGGNIPALVANILPAVKKAREDNPGLARADLAAKAVEANTWQSIADLFAISPIIRDMVKAGSTKVVGAIYDIDSGTVAWLGQHPDQEKLLAKTSGPK